MNATKMDRYRRELEEMRSRLIQGINRLAAAAVENIQAPGDISSLPTHAADHDSEGLDEKIEVDKVETQLLADVEAALKRIDAGTFGQCQGCGQPIATERLDALPYTPYCVTCAAENGPHEPA